MTTSIATEYAIRAWTRRHSGVWTDAEELELRDWLRAAPENRAAYAKVAEVWRDAAALADRFPRRSFTRRVYRRSAIAAASVAVAIAILAVSLWPVGSKWWNGEPQRWTAEQDKPRALILSDGTHVLLDAGSEMVASIGWHARHVVLRRGEALLTVAHDPSRPFELDSGSGHITDLGTRFDVELLRGTTRITVLEGRVGVSTSGHAIALTAGQAGGYDRDGVLLPVTTTGSSAVLWAAGKRHFDREPLADVLERLARYHDVSFVFSEPGLQQLRLSGTFRIDELAVFLRTLAAALPIDVRQVGPQRFEIRSRGGSSQGAEHQRVDVGANR